MSEFSFELVKFIQLSKEKKKNPNLFHLINIFPSEISDILTFKLRL